ncbi:MAG: hypothetical protein ACP5KP_04700 [Candidatus Micrarchaeia archaeon]
MSKFNRVVRKVVEFSMLAATSLILSCAFLHRTPKVEEMVVKQAEVNKMDNEVVPVEVSQEETDFWCRQYPNKSVEKVKDALQISICSVKMYGLDWDKLTIEEKRKEIDFWIHTGEMESSESYAPQEMPKVSTWK